MNARTFQVVIIKLVSGSQTVINKYMLVNVWVNFACALILLQYILFFYKDYSYAIKLCNISRRQNEIMIVKLLGSLEIHFKET